MIMRIARREGFVVQAGGGVATLATHEAQKSAGIYEKTQRMNGREALDLRRRDGEE
jgi:hypothetical protein